MQKKVIYLIAGLILFLALCFISAGRGDVHDLRIGTDSARNELEDIERAQRKEAETLERAASAADRSQQAIRDSAERADRVQELERSDAEIIRESQSIINRVRARGKTEN